MKITEPRLFPLVILPRTLGNHKSRPLLFLLRIPSKWEDPQRHQLHLLTLISKKIEASSTHDFQSVSLISGLYKILVLSNRIKEILHEAIDDNQFAFIKDRNVTDCILIANEGVKDCRHREIRTCLTI